MSVENRDAEILVPGDGIINKHMISPMPVLGEGFVNIKIAVLTGKLELAAKRYNELSSLARTVHKKNETLIHKVTRLEQQIYDLTKKAE